MEADPDGAALPQSAIDVAAAALSFLIMPPSRLSYSDDLPAAPPRTVYVDGVFDLFHPGHVAFLKKARAAGGPGARLLVGVISDEDAQWKRLPYMSHAERLTMVRHCTEVDAVIESPPLVVSMEFLRENGITLVVHGDDDRQEKFFGEPIAAGCMRYVPYTSGISTTALVERVLSRAAAPAGCALPVSER